MSRNRHLAAPPFYLLAALLALGLVALMLERGLGTSPASEIGPRAALFVAATPALLWLAALGVGEARDLWSSAFASVVAGALIAAPVACFAIHWALEAPITAPPALDPLGLRRIVAAIAVVGVLEETGKFLAIRSAARLGQRDLRPFQELCIAIATGLGFAAYESGQRLLGPDWTGSLAAALAASVSTAAAHLALAAVLGAGLAVAASARVSEGRRRALRLAALLATAALNGGLSLALAVSGGRRMPAERLAEAPLAFGLATLTLLIATLALRTPRLAPAEMDA